MTYLNRLSTPVNRSQGTSGTASAKTTVNARNVSQATDAPQNNAAVDRAVKVLAQLLARQAASELNNQQTPIREDQQ